MLSQGVKDVQLVLTHYCTPYFWGSWLAGCPWAHAMSTGRVNTCVNFRMHACDDLHYLSACSLTSWGLCSPWPSVPGMQHCVRSAAH
jgi:hypothetical protein